MKDKPRNIFRLIFDSVFNLKDYSGFLKMSGGRVFVYSLCMVLLTYVVTFIIPTAGILPAIYKIDRQTVDENVPYFEIRGGRFYIAEDVEYADEAGTLLIYATSKNPVSMEQAREVLRGYMQGFVISSESLLIKNLNQIQEFNFASMSEFAFTREDVYPLLPAVKVFVVAIYLFAAAAYVGAYFIGWVVCALLGFIVNSFAKAPVGFKEIFYLSAFGRTAPIILKMISFMLFANGLHFTLFYALFVLYIVFALISVRADSAVPTVEDGTEIN